MTVLFQVREYVGLPEPRPAAGNRLWPTGYDFSFVLYNGRLMFVPTVGLT